MYSRMVVNVVVDAIPPAVPPSIGLEKLLQDGCGIKFLRQPHGASIEDKRPKRMIGHQAIILEPKLIRFSPPYKTGYFLPARSCDTGSLLDSFLGTLQNAHDVACIAGCQKTSLHADSTVFMPVGSAACSVGIYAVSMSAPALQRPDDGHRGWPAGRMRVISGHHHIRSAADINHVNAHRAVLARHRPRYRGWRGGWVSDGLYVGSGN